MQMILRECPTCLSRWCSACEKESWNCGKCNAVLTPNLNQYLHGGKFDHEQTHEETKSRERKKFICEGIDEER